MSSPASPPASCEKCAFLFGPETPLDPSTVFADILGSNIPPAELNIPAIREFVARGSARRTRLDAKIASLRASLDALLQERDPLDAEIRKHEGALSPLRRMPTELLSLIFKYTLPPHAPGARSGPWVIGAVCSRWRTIVLSQPSLWSSIVVHVTDLEDSGERIINETQATLEAHLERSGESPLNITFDLSDEDNESELFMLETLACHCERWETLTISGPERVYSRLAQVGIRGCLPLLRQLHVTIWPDYLEYRDDDPLDIFEVCPKLKEVSLNGRYRDGHTLITAKFPFSQLLRFSASNSWTRHLNALRSAPNLVDCVLHGINPVDVPPCNTITLPYLRRLSLSTPEILDFLDTPTLQELYCDNQSSQLRSFLQRLPKLQKLVVTKTPSAPDIAGLLHAAPTITTLGIYLPVGFASELLSALALPTQSGQPNKIPALESISIRFLRYTMTVPDSVLSRLNQNFVPPLDQDLFVQTLEAYQHGGGSTIKLFCPKFKPSPHTLARMEALRSQGMQILVFADGHLLYRDMVPQDFRLYDLYDDHSWV